MPARSRIVLAAIVGLALPSPVSGGDPEAPARCIARWPGPGASCPLRETVKADAIGRDEPSARARVAGRLPHAVEAARQRQAFQAGSGARSAYLVATEGCTEIPASEVVISCFPEPDLATARYCYLEIPGYACGEGRGFWVKGKVWKEAEAVRDEACEALDRAAAGNGASESTLACAAACWQAARLTCSDGGGAP